MILKLYVSGTVPRSQLAIRRLNQICRQIDECDVEVIDVLVQPERAEAARILATPTLVKEGPPPPRRIIGDLRDADWVRVLLDVETMDLEAPN